MKMIREVNHMDVIKSLDRVCEFRCTPTVNLLSIYQSKGVDVLL